MSEVLPTLHCLDSCVAKLSSMNILYSRGRYKIMRAVFMQAVKVMKATPLMLVEVDGC